MKNWRLFSLFFLLCINLAQAKLDVRIVADIPNSLHTTDPNHTRQQILAMIIKALPDQSRGGVWLYGQTVNQIIPLQNVDATWRTEALKVIESIQLRTEDNDLPEAMMLSTIDWADLNNQDEKHLILLVDSNSSNATASLERIALLAERGVKIHVIAHSEIPNAQFYKHMTTLTQGAWIHQLPSAMPEHIVALMHRITHQQAFDNVDEYAPDRVPPAVLNQVDPVATEPEFVYAPEYKQPILKDESALLAQLEKQPIEENPSLPQWLQAEEQALLNESAPPVAKEKLTLESNTVDAPSPLIVEAAPVPTSAPVAIVPEEPTQATSESEFPLVADVNQANDARATESNTGKINWFQIELLMLIANIIIVMGFFIISQRRKTKELTGSLDVDLESAADFIENEKIFPEYEKIEKVESISEQDLSLIQSPIVLQTENKLLASVPETNQAPEAEMPTPEENLPQTAFIDVDNFLTENEPISFGKEVADPLVQMRRLGETLQHIVDSSPELIEKYKAKLAAQQQLDLNAWIESQGKK